MSDIDLSAANAAAHEFIANEVGWDAGALMADQASHMVATIAPLIEAAVRASIVRDIEERRADLLDPSTPGYLNIGDPRSWITGTRWAANLARGEQP